MARWRETLVKATLLIASIMFSLVALEIGLRVHKGEWGYTNFRFPQGALFANSTSFDAELGWVPEQGVQRPWGTTVTILENGIRSNGRGEFWEGTEHPVLAIGDSYTFGNQVSDWETWPAQLEKLSGRRVINGGVFGYGVDQAFLRARRLLSRYRFSTVVFSVIPDDIRRCQMSVIFNATKPYFDLQDGRLTLENVPVPAEARASPEGNGLLITLEHSRFSVALEHSLLVHSVMIRLAPEWWGTGHISRQTQIHDEKKGGRVACALLHELEGLTKLQGSELIVLVQRTEVETPSEATATKSVLSCLTDPATRVLDLQPALSELKAEDPSRYRQLYFPNGGHMTADGNQLVAREILPILTER
jgi:hypothetical protein